MKTAFVKNSLFKRIPWVEIGSIAEKDRQNDFFFIHSLFYGLESSSDFPHFFKKIKEEF